MRTENSDVKIRNLEQVDLSIEVSNHAERIFTLIQNNDLSIIQRICHNNPRIIILATIFEAIYVAIPS